MKQHFCDLCGLNVTGKASSSLLGIYDADEHGNGAVHPRFHACRRCWREFLAWVKAKQRHAGAYRIKAKKVK